MPSHAPGVVPRKTKPVSPGRILGLQRSAGNRATAALITGQGDDVAKSIQRQSHDAGTTTDRGPDPGHESTTHTATEESEPGPLVRVIVYEGRSLEVPEDEFEIVLRAIATRMQDDLITGARNSFNNAVDVYNHHVRNYNDSRVVGFILESVSGSDLPTMELALARAALQLATEKVDAFVNDPSQATLRAATLALSLTERRTNHVNAKLQQYMEDIVGSGENVVLGLHITSTACFAIAAVAGGAVLAPAAGAGLGVVKAGAVMGGSTALLSSLSGSAGRALAGDDLVLVDEMMTWGKDGVLGALGGGAGGAIAGKVAGPLSRTLAARLGPQFPDVAADVLEKTIANALEGGLSNSLQGAMADTVSAFEGNMTTEKFLTNVSSNLIAGGLAGAIQGRLRSHRGTSLRQIAGSGEDMAVLW